MSVIRQKKQGFAGDWASTGMELSIHDGNTEGTLASLLTLVLQLFDRHYPALHRYLRRRIGADVADDLAAQTFAVAMHGRRRYDADRAEPGPWLWGIAHNLLREHCRSEERPLLAYARTGVDPVQPAEADEAVARADAAGLAPRLAAAEQ